MNTCEHQEAKETPENHEIDAKYGDVGPYWQFSTYPRRWSVSEQCTSHNIVVPNR